ncbi:MAG: LEA type 2 family protein [Dysgonamonadaceae bacterium]|jgi:hypothetical protein|nr:LEA type 2 family protein [Dysgonamonadaceae bacterium]
MKKLILILATVFMLNGCGVMEQITGAYNFSQCEYTYNSLTGIQLAGINIGNASSISLANIANIATILSGKSLQTIPFNMTLNLNVKNPNEKTAAFLNAMDYAISINEMDFTSGKLDVPVRIEAGQTQVLPISVGVDLMNLINRYSQDRVARELGSFIGINSGSTKVTVRLWPSISVGNTSIKSPAAIPIVFNFGGK